MFQTTNQLCFLVKPWFPSRDTNHLDHFSQRTKPPSACCKRYTAEDSTRAATRRVKRMVPTV